MIIFTKIETLSNNRIQNHVDQTPAKLVELYSFIRKEYLLVTEVNLIIYSVTALQKLHQHYIHFTLYFYYIYYFYVLFS